MLLAVSTVVIAAAAMVVAAMVVVTVASVISESVERPADVVCDDGRIDAARGCSRRIDQRAVGCAEPVREIDVHRDVESALVHDHRRGKVQLETALRGAGVHERRSAECALDAHVRSLQLRVSREKLRRVGIIGLVGRAELAFQR